MARLPKCAGACALFPSRWGTVLRLRHFYESQSRPALLHGHSQCCVCVKSHDSNGFAKAVMDDFCLHSSHEMKFSQSRKDGRRKREEVEQLECINGHTIVTSFKTIKSNHESQSRPALLHGHSQCCVCVKSHDSNGFAKAVMDDFCLHSSHEMKFSHTHIHT